MESKTEPLTTISFDRFDEAIIRALRKHPRGVRNIQLNRESKVNGEGINVKTFNLHLKRLFNWHIVERNEESRAKVFYKLRPTGIELQRRKMMAFARKISSDLLISLHDRRKEFSEEEAEKLLDDILSAWNIMQKILLINAILERQNPVAFSLAINEATDYSREFAVEIGKTIGQSEQERAFFQPLLKRIRQSCLKLAPSIEETFEILRR
jgi:DNA-binding transcriptional ArsR family regulator